MTEPDTTTPRPQPAREERADAYSGIPWVYVTREEVWAHPKGKLSGILWAIAAYLIVAGLVKMGILRTEGVPLGWAILFGCFPLLCGIGLILRMPFAVILATISAAMTVFQLVGGIGSIAGNAFSTSDDTATYWLLFHLLASVGIVFHLMDGDRPNFIYRHRYRKYSAVQDPDDD